MFFSFLGKTVCRFWWLFLLGWGLILLVTHLLAPPWDKIAQDREFAFLPADAPSQKAAEIYQKAFPADRLTSNIVLVLADRRPGQLQNDLQFIQDVLAPGLRKVAEAEGGLADEAPPPDEPLFDDEPARPAKAGKKSIIASIHTPNAPGVGALLVSEDRREMLVVVEMTTEFLSADNWPTIDRIQDMLREMRAGGKIPARLNITLTGSAVVGRDHTKAELQSVKMTETLTIVFVVVLLLAIYRAPLLALIPLVTVALSVKVALNILAILGAAGYIRLFQGIQIYVIILAYGAGVDYCLFLTARYKEELDNGRSGDNASCAAVSHVGAAVTASAATVICGIAMMLFARFGKFRDAGFAIPLSIALVLLAALTFSPSLLRLAGRWAFWPRHLPRRGDAGAARRFYHEGGLDWVWEKIGAVLLRRPGAVWAATVAVMTPAVVVAALFYNQLSYDLIGTLPADVPSVIGTQQLAEHFPAGLMGPTTVLLVDPGVNFASKEGREIVARVTGRLKERREELALADVRSLTAPLGITPAGAHPLASLSDIPLEVRREAAARGAEQHYLTDMGGRKKIGTRLELVMEHSPFSHRSVDDLQKVEQAVREALPAGVRGGAKLYFVGTTASVRDLADVTRQDRTRIDVLVVASVFVVLVLLLRRLWLPVYLLLSVLFSYYVTLGVTFAVFYLLDPHGFTGIDWKVAVFLFTILIAVGEDYNIFLITRIHEEDAHRGPLEAVTHALAKTGPIISSCGVIMAGTFASLLAGSLLEMKQLGFALVFGVLLDTFVVRPVLLPAFLILLRRNRPAAGEGVRAAR
jgi:RND superfamily putative drug exporter